MTEDFPPEEIVGTRILEFVENSTGERVPLICSSNDINALWWVDLMALVHGLSKGDQSLVLAAYEQSQKGDDVRVMSGHNSVIGVLWNRLQHLGYIKAGAVEETPPEIAKILRSWTLTEAGRTHIKDFLVASLMSDPDPEAVKARGIHFEKMKPFHVDKPTEFLQYLRGAFRAPGATVNLEGADNIINLFKIYEIPGFTTALGGKRWEVTEEGAKNLPFFLDHYIHHRNKSLN